MDAIFASGADGSLPLLTKFGVEWDILVSQGLMFVILALILYKFVFKPVIKTADERRLKIAQGLEDAQKARESLLECEKQCSQKISAAAAEASAIIAKTRDEAKSMLDKAAAQASEKAEEAMEKAKLEIASERERMKAELKAELSALVVKTAESVLKGELDSGTKSRIAQSAASKLGEK